MLHNGTKMIETSRLLLLTFTFEDCSDILKNWIADPKIQNEYGEPIYTNEADVNKLLDKWISNYRNLDFYKWAIIEKESNKNIGQIAFCKVYSEHETVEIEYCIGKDFWGKGYEGEALSAVIDYTFKNTDFIKLEAFHRVENIKSGRVLEKSIMNITENVQRFFRENMLPYG